MKNMNIRTIMKAKLTTTLLALAVAGASLHGQILVVDVGDFRIGATTYSETTRFDPGFSETTRAVVGAPVQVNSTFSGTSQNPGEAVPDDDDIGLRTFSAATQINTLNRFASSTDGGTTGAARAGAVQWSFSLASITSYLAANDLTAAELSLRMVTTVSDAAREYDLYLSYTLPAEGMSLTSISADNARTNYDTFWWPSQSADEGDLVGGTHEILQLQHTGAMDFTFDLLPLFQAGVEEFNLIMASGDFLSSRTIGIDEGSGISLAAIPEPRVYALLFGAFALFFAAYRRFHRLSR